MRVVYAGSGLGRQRAVLEGRALRLMAALALALTTWLGVAHADDVYVDVAINGRFLERGALVFGDRTYVRLSDVAQVLDGRYVYDSDLKVAFVLTGAYQNLVEDRLTELNPALGAYNPIAPIASQVGIRYGVPGPHITIGFTPSGVAVTLEVMYTAGTVSAQPWFDQDAAHVHWSPGIGQGYSQHLHLVDPELIELGGRTVVAFNGRALDLPVDAFLWVENDLYVRLRDLAAASGGGVGWNPEARLATAKVVAGPDLSRRTLAALNEPVAEYYAASPTFDPAVGYRFSPDGPGIIVGLDGEGRAAVFGAYFPADAAPWFPWYDQADGAPVEIPGFGQGYSQHIYLQARGTIQD